MLRQIQPRNARSKRALEKKSAKAIENPKTCLFLRGTTCSQITQDCLAQLFALRQPLAKKFTKKNAIHPFEDASSLEFFSEKNDASLVVFGSSSKKRPHTVTMTRMFGHKVLDMLELYLDAAGFRRLEQFKSVGEVKSAKFAVGARPMLVFAGPAFESTVPNEATMAKSMLADFFRLDSSPGQIDVEGLQHVICVTADDTQTGEAVQSTGSIKSTAESRTTIHVRVYMIRTKRSGQRLPRVEVEECGPRMSFRLGRMKQPDEAMEKESLKVAKTTEERPKKNISTDSIGDKIGRVHLGKQDLSELQTRKMKGLKRSRAEREEETEADSEIEFIDEDYISEDEPNKRRK